MCHQDGRSVTLTHMQVCQYYEHYRVPRKCAGSVASDTTAMEGGGRSLPMKNNSAGMYKYSEGTSEPSRRDRIAVGRNGALEQTADIWFKVSWDTMFCVAFSRSYETACTVFVGFLSPP